MGYIFDDWKKLLDSFQACVEKDLEEIHEQKAEVQQMKTDIFNKLDSGKYYRDEDRIVISAPEIIIGNVDKSGQMQGNFGRVVIRGSNVALEGVGSNGNIICRAPSIRQQAVDPGVDGQENVVCDTSEIISQACDIVLHSADATDVFSQAPVLAGKGGIRIHADNNLQLEATVSSEGRKKQIDENIKMLTKQADDLKKQIDSQKKKVDESFSSMKKLLDEEMEYNNPDAYLARVTLGDIEDIHTEINQILPFLYQSTVDFIHSISQLAEVNRKKKALNAEKNAIKTGDTFKNDTTGAFMSIQAETISVATTDGDGNLHTNPEAGIGIRTPRCDIDMRDDKSKLIENGGLAVNAQNITFSSTEPSNDGKELPIKGTFEVHAKDINIEAVDYKQSDNIVKEKELTKDGRISMTAHTVEVSTCNPTGVDRDDKGKLTKGEFKAEGDIIVKSKTVAVEAFDYEVSDGKLKPKTLTKDSNMTIRSEKMSLLASDTEGKATGSINLNAKAVAVKSMDVDKEKLSDKSLASGSSMLLLSEKMYVGAKDKSNKSKKLQTVSEEMGLFADKTFEAQQGDGKATVQLSGGNVAVGGSKTQVYGETTINGKTDVKGEFKAPKGTIDNLEAKTSFKSPNISDGIAIPTPAAPSNLSTKLKAEDAPKES